MLTNSILSCVTCPIEIRSEDNDKRISWASSHPHHNIHMSWVPIDRTIEQEAYAKWNRAPWKFTFHGVAPAHPSIHPKKRSHHEMDAHIIIDDEHGSNDDEIVALVNEQRPFTRYDHAVNHSYITTPQ